MGHRGYISTRISGWNVFNRIADHSTIRTQIVQLDDERGEFVKRGEFDHPYPTTKVMFIPDRTCQKRDLVATTGDYLRVWNINDDGIQMDALFNNVRQKRW